MMLSGVVLMGISLSFLLNAGYGTDTCSFMNASISARLGVSLGPVMVVSNVLLFIPQLIWGRKFIGIGTLCNMFLIGYITDFCMFLQERLLPFPAVRIAWDFLAIAVGVLCGGTLTAGTVILAFTIGPAVFWIGRLIKLLSRTG